MKWKAVAVTLLLMWGSLWSRGAGSGEVQVNVPEVVTLGFEALQKYGTLAGIDAWLAGSVRETDDAFQDEVAGRLNRVQTWLGRAAGFEPIRVVPLSASTRRVYVAVKFEKGVGWMYFDCYLREAKWIVTRFEFQTNANLVLPAAILGGG